MTHRFGKPRPILALANAAGCCCVCLSSWKRPFWGRRLCLSYKVPPYPGASWWSNLPRRNAVCW